MDNLEIHRMVSALRRQPPFPMGNKVLGTDLHWGHQHPTCPEIRDFGVTESMDEGFLYPRDQVHFHLNMAKVIPLLTSVPLLHPTRPLFQVIVAYMEVQQPHRMAFHEETLQFKLRLSGEDVHGIQAHTPTTLDQQPVG